jgi:hypothetical protein
MKTARAIPSLLALFLIDAGAAVVTLTPTADAFVTNGTSGSLTNNNYGGAGALGAAAAGLPKGEFDSVLQFDLSSAKSTFDSIYGAGQWSLADASLKLTANSPNNAIFNGFGSGNTAGLFNINWFADDTWVEGTGTPGAPTTNGITFATLPGFLGTTESLNLGGNPFNFDGSSTTATTYDLALGSNFVNEVNSGSIVSLSLSAADATVAALWASRSVGTPSSRPTLTLVVPEPGKAMLLGLGLCLLAARRKRP